MMNLLEGIAIAPPGFVANYVLSSIFGVGVTYYLLGWIFEKRMSGMLWWAYFGMKAASDACLWYAVQNGSAGTWVESLSIMWTSVLAVVSLMVVLVTFKGNVGSIGACSVICDLLAGAVTSSSWSFANVLIGIPIGRGYFASILTVNTLTDAGLHLLIFGALVAFIAFLIHVPALWLLRRVRCMTGRYWMLWFAVSICFIGYLVYAATWEFAHLWSVYPTSTYILYSVIPPFVGLLILLWLSLRDAAMRARVMADCAKLARDYEETVRAQLATLDRDRAVLEGHERALTSLGGEGTSLDLTARIQELEQSYQRLSAGLYCIQPALDAVLTAGAGRLRELGVQPVFTVAAAPARTTAPAMTALALLNLASDVAAHVEEAQDAEVELRVRSIGERLLFHLEVPKAWGYLGARRFLRPVMNDRSSLVRERRHKDRRVVLVLTSADEEATCI